MYSQASYGDAMTAYKTLQADIERSLQAESVLSKDSEHCDLSSTGDERMSRDSACEREVEEENERRLGQL